MPQKFIVLENRWRLALHGAAFGVWDLDPNLGQVHFSPQWKTMLGYEGTDAFDSTAAWRSRVHPDDLSPMLDAQRSHMEGRHPAYEAEFRLRAADGAYRWVLSRGMVAQRDAQGQALRMVGTLTDITPRRAAESLRLERDRAEAASRARTEFLSRMSHELRTPLNAVLGFAQLLSHGVGSLDIEEQRRYVEYIETSGWHLLQLIDNLLGLPQVDSGERPVRRPEGPGSTFEPTLPVSLPTQPAP